jgi:hypothetical protein
MIPTPLLPEHRVLLLTGGRLPLLVQQAEAECVFELGSRRASVACLCVRIGLFHESQITFIITQMRA